MPPPVLQRRMSMPMLHGAQLEHAHQEQQQQQDDEEETQQPRSLATAGRTPTMDSIRAARRRASTVVSNNGSPSGPHSGGEDGDRNSTMPPQSVVLGDAEVRPPSRVPSSVASAPPAAPAKVLVKRRKSVPNTSSGSDAPSPPHRVDSNPPAPPPPPPPPQVASVAGDGGGDSQWRGNEDIVPIVLRDTTAPRPAHSRTSSTTRSDISGVRSQHASAQNTIELHRPTSYGADHRDASTSEHWGTSVSQHHQDSFTDASESLTRRLAQQFEAPPSAPPPPPPPPPNWKLGDTPRAGGGDAPVPPPAAPLPPPPKRVSQFIVDEAPLPAANDIKARVEQMQRAEWARQEEERLQQPGRSSFTTASRLDFSARRSPKDYDDGQYSYVTEDTAEEVLTHHDTDEAPRTGGMADFANAVSAAARGLNVSTRAHPQSAASGRNQSPQDKRSHDGASSSSPPASFVRTAPISFTFELDGVSVVLYHQLSENSQLKINNELANIVFDAVRGPVHRLDMVRVEHIAVSEDSDNRAIVEGAIRGARNAADRRLAIRLLVSFFRGPSSVVLGQRLMQFPSLVRDAPSVVVRRMYVNDVDVLLVPAGATGASGAPNTSTAGGEHSNTPGSVAAFEARRAKLKMATTPSVTAASFREDGTPRNLSPTRYPDRAIYHHISTPAAQAQSQRGDASTHYQSGGAGPGTELSVFHSPSNGFGVTRYRTRKYEYC